MAAGTRGWRMVLAGMTLGAMAVVVLQGCNKSSKATKTKLAGIVFQEDQFFRLVQLGMQDAADKAGVELLQGNSENKPDKELNLINTYIAQKVDAILISARDAQSCGEAMKRAKAAGIVIIAHNTPLAGDLHAAYIESSAFDLGVQTGKAARKYIEMQMAGKAKIAIIGYHSQLAEQSDARRDGFKSEVGKLPGVKFVVEQDAWMPDMAMNRVGAILTANPDVNVIWSANEGGTLGATLAVKNANKAGTVAVFGTDASEQLIEQLQSPDNILQAVTSQRPFEVGQMAVEAALKALKKEPVEKLVQMNGVLLSREEPEKLKAFDKQLKAWAGKSAK